MSRRTLGLLVCVVAWGGMITYLAVAGLDRADQLASVGGALIGGAEVLAQLIEWGGAAALLGAGAVVGYRWLRSNRA